MPPPELFIAGAAGLLPCSEAEVGDGVGDGVGLGVDVGVGVGVGAGCAITVVTPEAVTVAGPLLPRASV